MGAKTARTIFYIAFISAFFAAFAGFWRMELLWIEIALIAYSGMWLALRKKAPALFFFLSVAAALSGILLGARPWCMIIYSGLSLACWELVKTEQAITEFGEGTGVDTYTYSRLRSLAIVVFSGICLACLGWSLRIDMPFPLALGVAIILFFCIGKIISSVKST